MKHNIAQRLRLLQMATNIILFASCNAKLPISRYIIDETFYNKSVYSTISQKELNSLMTKNTKDDSRIREMLVNYLNQEVVMLFFDSSTNINNLIYFKGGEHFGFINDALKIDKKDVTVNNYLKGIIDLNYKQVVNEAVIISRPKPLSDNKVIIILISQRLSKNYGYKYLKKFYRSKMIEHNNYSLILMIKE